MTVHQHKQDKNLIVCSECAESHTIDLNEYVESAFSECSICGYVDEKAREEYMWWSHKLDSEMSDWEDGSLPMEKEQAPMVELVYTTDLKSVGDNALLVRVQLGAPNE